MTADQKLTATAPPRAADRCDYCQAPLPADNPSAASSPNQPKYCCYGCRILGETAHRPIALTPDNASPWFKIAIGAVLAGQGMLLGVAVNLAPPAGYTRWLLHGALMISSLGVLILLGPPLWRSALEEIRAREVSVELLFLAGIAGALGASLHSTITGAGAVYYEVVGVLLAVYAVGRTLGARSRARALAETRHLRRAFETCRKIAPDGSTFTVPVAEIHPGDEVRVLPGEPIPIDGRIVFGKAFVCETPLTGEPFPVVRRPGDAVLAGSYSEDGELRVTATAPGTGRRLDQLLFQLETARERPCRMQAQAGKIVRWFLPLVLASSAATFVFWTWRAGWSTGLFNALAVLLVACPCAMGLATPVALWSGLAALAARGLVLRGGDEIELLAGVNRMVFDKTGTLSEERFSLIDLATEGSAGNRQAVTAQLEAVQNVCSHPVARAFHTRGPAPVSCVVRQIKTIPALGVEAWIDSGPDGEHHMRIGRRELMTDLTAESALLSRLCRRPADYPVYVEVDGRLRAVASVSERMRESAATATRALEQEGVSCSVMTGDRAERAFALLGEVNVAGGLTPQDKATRVERMIGEGCRVGFVGDGINDALAIRAATVGVALGHGAGVATSEAGAVLYGGDLRVLPWAVVLCRRVRDSIRSNLVFAAFYNVVGMALAATGMLHPVASALLMVVSSFTVSWRALRSTECGHACGGLPAGALKPSPSASRFKPSVTPISRFWTEYLAVPHPASYSPPATSKFQTTAALLVTAQAPFLIYLGRLDYLKSAGLALVLLLLGVWIGRFRPRNTDGTHTVFMTFAMLGLGNWGMMLGWWADAGFARVHACCMGDVSQGFSLWNLTQMPWMNLGMLLLGLPPMLSSPFQSYRGLGRWSYGFLAAAGMLWGMSFGSYVFMKWLEPVIADKFLLSLAGMIVGMLLGMFLCCEFGRAILWAWPRKRRKIFVALAENIRPR